MFDLEFFRGKRVLITGHTGFKGSWMSRILVGAGADVTGYSLEPPTQPNLYTISRLEDAIHSVTADVRDFEQLAKVFDEVRPEIVFHLAAQPIVRTSYQRPVDTYEINVMGTVHVCECIRRCPEVRSFVNVTTDKVYQNHEWEWGYRESDPLDGWDPYSNSKSCSELVTHSYAHSFFEGREIAISTARAGNVIGGGDFAKDRIIPDCIRAIQSGTELILRNPDATRPFQHVLEPVMAYLLLAKKQYEDRSYQGCYNVGPDDSSCVTTAELVETFAGLWGPQMKWKIQSDDGPHEANFLKLDSSKIKSRLGWRPVWDIGRALLATVEWTKAFLDGRDVAQIMDQQIEEYIEDSRQE